MSYRKAMGAQIGDYLDLRNQWSHVTVYREYGNGDEPVYIVSGDLLDTRTTSQEFDKLGEAVAYALKSLALYQEGRA